MKIIIKKFDKKYKKEIIRLIFKTFGKMDLEEVSEFEIEDISKSEYRELRNYLVFVKQKMIGTCGLYSAKEHPENIIFNGWLVIKSKYRNKGIGTKLIKKLEKEAKILNKKFIYVVAYNPSIKFYYKMGFKKSKSKKLRKFYMPKDCTLMYKRLL